jgi:hypothetical protein
MWLETKLPLILALKDSQRTPLVIVIDLPRMSRTCCSFSINLGLPQLAPHPQEHCMSYLEKFLLKSPISAKVCVMNLSLVIEPSASLNSQDSPCQTYGCRHGTPYNCSKNSMENVCAFVTADNICSKPPAGWARQYEKLLKIA